MLEESENYLIFVYLFLDLVHPKHAYLVHLPFNGSVLHQPHTTMAVLKLLKGEYVSYLNEQQTKETEKMRNKRR